MNKKTSQSGFTLIELIAVMVILGILAAVIVPRLTTMTRGAYESNVRNMYGLIKNEVTAQATKAAMSGNYLETYPEPGALCEGCPATRGDMLEEDYYLKTWVGDYDADQWSSFQKDNVYDNSTEGADAATHAVLFMYHPHGKPGSAITWGGGDGTTQLDPSSVGGTATSLEDIYWIYYAPKTSAKGDDRGRELDGYVMAAWRNGNAAGTDIDLIFNGTIGADGEPTAGNEHIISDLKTHYAPN